MECEPLVQEASSSVDNEGRRAKMREYCEYALAPLEESNIRYAGRQSIQNNNVRPSWQGPLKALRLLILVAILPTLFIAIPLYMRYFVFSGQMYPVSMSDMRLIDKKVSTTWCQRQLLHSNATFNAFLMSSQPKFANDLVPVEMTRHLMLEDDMKEYWGFYLLQGSIVTVSTCVRWSGASLIMIRGHKHLQECAYIGDDSSEELDEIIEANIGKLENITMQKRLINKPGDMIRQLGEIHFHAPKHNNLTHRNMTRERINEDKDILDPVVLKNILLHLNNKQHKPRSTRIRHKNIVTVPQLQHRYRDTNVNEDEEKFLSFKDLELPLEHINITHNDTVESQKNDNGTIINEMSNNSTQVIEDKEFIDILEEEEEIIEEKDSYVNSSEVLDEIFEKLKTLGDRGRGVLNKLNNKLKDTFENNHTVYNNVDLSKNKTVAKEEEDAEEKLDVLKQIIMQLIDESKYKNKGVKRSWKEKDPRIKRDIKITPSLHHQLNDEDERGNTAMEEGFEADGFADHHHRLNETTLNDMSRSEFWSSFSSSEEALLECEGLILNLPLTPHKQCQKTSSDDIHEQASLSNTITYSVPTNGYYFFVFNSENEVQTNYIRVKFNLQKTIYDLTKGTVMECKNSSSKCAIPLSFFSGEKVVLEVPINDNESLWNEEFVVMSECEPRTALYIVCVITVPVLIIVMAFQ